MVGTSGLSPGMRRQSGGEATGGRPRKNSENSEAGVEATLRQGLVLLERGALLAFLELYASPVSCFRLVFSFSILRLLPGLGNHACCAGLISLFVHASRLTGPKEAPCQN